MNKSLYTLVSQHLQRLDEIPLFGNAHPLNLDELSNELSKKFGIQDLEIQIKKQERVSSLDLGAETLKTPLFLSPLDQSLFWIMTKNDRDRLLTKLMFQKEKKELLPSKTLLDGFYQFILLEALSSAQTLEPIREMSVQLGNSSPSNESGIMITVEIALPSFSTWGRLFISDSFRKAWVQHFAAFPPFYMKNRFSKTLKLELGVNAGSVELPVKDWKRLKVGDLLIPDTFEHDKGTLVFGEIPLFQVTTSDKKRIKINSTLYSQKDPMEENTPTQEQSLDTLQGESLNPKIETDDLEEKGIKEVPINISIELVRLQISLDELMKLSPGNILEIPPFSEKKVALLANGQKIGVAEIVALEGSIGLKILEK